MTKLEAYQTNLGLFVRLITGLNFGDRMKVNGIPGDTFEQIKFNKGYNHKVWVYLKDIHEITSIEGLKQGKNNLNKFVLKISSIANDEIPLERSLEEVGYYVDGDGDIAWKNYSEMQSLYKPEYVREPDSWQPEEFEITMLRKINIDSYESPADMKITQDFTGTWVDSAKTVDLSSVVTYEDIERILTPEFLLHERPCMLSSQQVYGIVRNFVKTNINGKYARVTSDYDFCFTVKKRVAIKPITTRTEIKNARGRSYAQPKFKTTVTEFKEKEIFEMTHAGQNYSGYTPISGWRANNLKEMKEQMLSYLNTLMEEINKPVAECPHCNGTGHLLEEKIKTNDRELA